MPGLRAAQLSGRHKNEADGLEDRQPREMRRADLGERVAASCREAIVCGGARTRLCVTAHTTERVMGRACATRW
jgi:hypothetical protein